jgi:hypothetical protein
MSKQNKNRNGGMKDTEVLEYHFLFASTFTAGVFGLSANPTTMGTFATRLIAQADLWSHFRHRSLKFRLRVTPSTTAQQFVGFVGGVQDTPPATAQAIMELLPSVMMDVDQTIPSEWMSVPRADLAGPLPWYKAVPGAADATEESPGTLIVVGTGSEAFAVEVRGVMEFKTGLSTANTPLFMQARLLMRAERLRLERERESLRLRQLLAPTSPSVVLPSSNLSKLGP